MSWQRATPPPEVVRLTINVNTKEHPELAQFIWSQPWGQGAGVVRDILSQAIVKSGFYSPALEVPAVTARTAPAAPAAARVAEPAPVAVSKEDLTEVVNATSEIVGNMAGKY